MPATQYVLLGIARSIFLGVSTVYPHTQAWMGLLTGDPGYLGDQTDEVSGGSYARVQPTFQYPGSSTDYAMDIAFPTATADWGTVTHVAFFDAASGGNMLAYDDLPTPKAITTGKTVEIYNFSFAVALSTPNGGTGPGTQIGSNAYRITRYMNIILHGGTLDAQPGSWVGLSGQTFVAYTGVGTELNGEVDQGYAPEYDRRSISWSLTNTNPVTLTNSNGATWTIETGSTYPGWENASRTVVLFQDPDPVRFQNAAPNSISWAEYHTSHGTEGVAAGDILSLASGSMTIVL